MVGKNLLDLGTYFQKAGDESESCLGEMLELLDCKDEEESYEEDAKSTYKP